MTNLRKTWRELRPDGLADLAGSMTPQEIADVFGLELAEVNDRLVSHRLTAQPEKWMQSVGRNRFILRCSARIEGGTCSAPLDRDGACRWSHQHTSH